MYGLCDCNNFFVSCERVFDPGLESRPVIVLSNNDGCVISRSNEAKRIGIGMGQPFYQLRELVEREHVAVFSTNFILYGDMSDRVISLLREAVPAIEVYSIDEAFLNLNGLPQSSLPEIGAELSGRIKRYTGIPVSIGIAPTKTLAKIASKLCKKYPKLNGSCFMSREEDIAKVLKSFPIGDVWGIGRKHLKFLGDYGIATAADFAAMSPYIIRKQFTITGLRTWKELHGEPCISFEDVPPERQQICVSRSFATELYDFDEVHRSISNFAAMCAAKLRAQKSICARLTVFLFTNPHKENIPQYFDNKVINFDTATDSSLEIIRYAVCALHELFKAGYGYKKAGVILADISSKANMQQGLFDSFDAGKHNRLMKTMDKLNKVYGDKTLVVATQGFEGVKMNRNHLSRRYTTDWNDILEIKAD
jgi:DNA polymerase V